MPVNIAQAALGTELDIQTLDGVADVTIPEGTQHGKGSPERPRRSHAKSGGRGDLCIHVDVKIPTKLNREQRRLFEQLRETLPAENGLHEKSLFEKVKGYFV